MEEVCTGSQDTPRTVALGGDEECLWLRIQLCQQQYVNDVFTAARNIFSDVNSISLLAQYAWWCKGPLTQATACSTLRVNCATLYINSDK